MLYRSLSAFIALCVLLAAPSYAQDIDPTPTPDANGEVITFDDAVRIALEQSIGIRQAHNALQSSASQVAASRADFLPNLNVSVSGNQRFGTTFDQTVGGFVSENTQGANVGASTSITLFDGFGNIATLRRSQFDHEGTEFDLQRTRQEIVFQVMSNYLDVILSRENVRIQEENLEAAQRQLDQIEEFVRVGTQPRSDLYQQEAQLASAEFQLLEAQRFAQLNEMAMIQLLQLDPFGDYEFVTPAVEDEHLVPEQFNVVNLIQEAFERRTDLRAQEASLSASEQNMRVARSGYYPSLSLQASTGGVYSSQLDGFSLPEQIFDQRRTETLSFSISLPIFDRLQTRNQVQQARVQHDNSLLQLEGLQQEVAVQVRQAYLDYQTAEKQVDVARTQEIAAERALEAAQERYNVGSATLVEVSQAQAEYVSASSNRVQAQYDFIFQKRLIDFYVGNLDPAQPLFE